MCPKENYIGFHAAKTSQKIPFHALVQCGKVTNTRTTPTGLCEQHRTLYGCIQEKWEAFVFFLLLVYDLVMFGFQIARATFYMKEIAKQVWFP